MLHALLYYIKINNLYKIGITNNSINIRFSSQDRKLFKGIFTWEMSGEEAWKKEQEIIKTYKEFKYLGSPFLSSGGDTELFTKDILNKF